MANWAEEAFAPAERKYRSQVLQNTWGHLAPKRNKQYTGYIVFAVGCFGSDPLNPTVIQCDFGDLDSSPWFYDALTEFVGDEANRGEAGNVYRFDGTFKNFEFEGTIRRLILVVKDREAYR